MQVEGYAVPMALERQEGNDNYKNCGAFWPLLSALGASKKENDRLQRANYHFKVCCESKRVCMSVFKKLLISSSHTADSDENQAQYLIVRLTV